MENENLYVLDIFPSRKRKWAVSTNMSQLPHSSRLPLQPWQQPLLSPVKLHLSWDGMVTRVGGGSLVGSRGKNSYVSMLSCVRLFVIQRIIAQPGSSVHQILPARILEWVAIPFSRGSSQTRDWTHVSCIAGKFFTIWATREVQVQITKFS